MNKEVLFAKAKEAGIQDIEVLMSKTNTTSLEIFDQKVDNYKISESKQFMVRGLYKGNLGTCVIEEDSDEHIPFIISSIIQNAETITSEDEVEIYGECCDYPTIAHTPNTCLKESIETKIEVLKDIEQQLKQSDSRIEQVMGVAYQDIETGAELTNSKGVHALREDSFSILSASILVSDQEDKKSAYDVITRKDLNTFDVKAFSEKLKEQAVSKLHASQVKSGMYPVLMDREAMASLLRHLVCQFDGEDAYKGISLLQGKIQEKIFDKKLTILDDPLMIDGYSSAPFDDEGVACKTKTIVKSGVLQGYLHNLKSAKLMQTTSTGNGFSKAIAPTNFYIQNGDTSMEDMMREMKQGVYITEVNGLHAGYSEITTQFSLQAAGFFIENGEIAYPVNLITIAGNLLSLLQDVCLIGNDLKFELSGIGSPSILFPSIAVSGN